MPLHPPSAKENLITDQKINAPVESNVVVSATARRDEQAGISGYDANHPATLAAGIAAQRKLVDEAGMDTRDFSEFNSDVADARNDVNYGKEVAEASNQASSDAAVKQKEVDVARNQDLVDERAALDTEEEVDADSDGDDFITDSEQDEFNR